MGLIIQVGGSQAVVKMISYICVCVCLPVCLHFTKKIAWATNTEVGTAVEHGSRYPC